MIQHSMIQHVYQTNNITRSREMRGFSRERERGRVCEDESFRAKGVYHGSKDHGRDRSRQAVVTNKHSQKFNKWDNFSASFFFCNFPLSCEAADLWRAFERLGKVVDVYISRNLTRKGSRFGFVRFKVDRDAGRIEEGLNNLWFGSYKLRANKSKYSSKATAKAPAVSHRVYKEKAKARPGNNIIDGILFSDVVANNKKAPASRNKANQMKQTLDSCEVKKSADSSAPSAPVLKLKNTESAWLSNCLVGDLKHSMSVKNLDLLMQKENFYVEAIRFIGGNKVLLDCLSTDNRDKIFGNYEWWNVWFKWVVPWNSDFSTVGRLVRIRCFGVPLQAWCKESFFDIGSIWGEVLEIDDDTLDKCNLDYGTITILSKHWETISHDLKVSLDNTVFTIRVQELPPDQIEQGRAFSDDSSMEESSSEDYYSDSAAEELLKDDESVFSGKEEEKSMSSVHGSSIGYRGVENIELSSGKQIQAGSFFDLESEPLNSKVNPILNSEKVTDVSCTNGPTQLTAHKENPRPGLEHEVDFSSSSKAQTKYGPKEGEFVPESEASAQNANQVLVNVPGALMDKLENLSFTVNGIKERGFKSLAEILSNLDSNNLDLSFDKKVSRGKKAKCKQRRSSKSKGKLQVERLSAPKDRVGFARKGNSLNSEEERKGINMMGKELGVNFEKIKDKCRAGSHAC